MGKSKKEKWEEAQERMDRVRKEVDAMKGFKQIEFQPCLLCGKGMAHSNDLDFYRVKLERFMIDYGNVQMQRGLEMSMGAAASLASIMGPDRDLAKEPSPHKSFLICGPCAMDKEIPLAFLSQRSAEREED